MKTMVVMGEYPAEEREGVSKPCSNASYREQISTVTGAPCPVFFFDAARQRRLSR